MLALTKDSQPPPPASSSVLPAPRAPHFTPSFLPLYSAPHNFLVPLYSLAFTTVGFQNIPQVQVTSSFHLHCRGERSFLVPPGTSSKRQVNELFGPLTLPLRVIQASQGSLMGPGAQQNQDKMGISICSARKARLPPLGSPQKSALHCRCQPSHMQWQKHKE